MAAQYGELSNLLPLTYKRMIAAWLEEDCPSLDYGGFVVSEVEGEAKLLGKSKAIQWPYLGLPGTATLFLNNNPGSNASHLCALFRGIVAGVPFFNEVFAQLDCTVEWKIKEGDEIQPITICAIVRGPMRKLLLGERVALNILARCSGIATKTSSLLTILRSHGWNGILAGTRKTTPGFRLVEKYAILVGGADPHRHDLSSMTMLKDNHVWACYNKDKVSHTSGENITIADAIPSAVHAARAAGGFAVKIEVECRNLEEANAAVGAGADIVMLDNFSPDGVRDAALQLKDEWDAKGKPRGSFLVEVSGGLREDNVADFACEDVDILSTSSIHQGVGIVDFSLKVSVK
ncbi:nicotinate-nucleotide diphosphorylase (carboxylating) [Ophidiomyces ophidiicola]|uniref:Nicotinate-nucleotide diphosphorylase (Carboxylating) n=1 Tax=Ophidiomyces ophidiicola TaxID=1387563 RepID=A0ACB8UWB7_9EURO|nr:nicotinate-nucleotide diphosphorylase (carboxylating) [Ophidiomyces ophidiicola]KAI1911472.1 nicotinate-nucleotide diphosphorylase (carboxylating) [Ophidiomyces ophidiicola]KAI1913777.1 nicotinate-nucleotide diphosphorylase (carboxylating) [Ophidiomyces ophidiicola]KAI1926292.1 nicotinate-nucleotide diphosphorylase (carboxylating) [Ophidiomyces ophidiicola]KAI1943376.1 nicotinate-nucleotide diphosphorylase (carboxylating) [Ophidiomyces ophidiicola]KAI1953020.1 nicotinate-nucleotide diphosph